MKYNVVERKRNMNVQVTGFATIAKSSQLNAEDKAKLLAPKDGKVPTIVATLLDSEGNEVTIRGKLVESKAGSLTSRIAFKLSSFKLVYEDPKAAGEKSPADAKAKAAALAAELGLK